jgi:hypothetical protein
LAEAQRFATIGVFADAAAISLTLLALEKSGTFLTATERWREKDDTAMTILANSQHHFTKVDKERQPPQTHRPIDRRLLPWCARRYYYRRVSSRDHSIEH